eukprot:gene1381-5280_t
MWYEIGDDSRRAVGEIKREHADQIAARELPFRWNE